MQASAIFNSSELSDELQALKSEVSRLLNNHGEGVFDAAKNQAEALADQIKAALYQLGGTLRRTRGPSRGADRGAPDRNDGIRLRTRCRHRLDAEEALT